MARRRRSNRRRGGIGAGRIAAITMLATATVALTGAFGWLYFDAKTHAPLDKDTHCPATGATSITAVLFDTTDPLPEVTLADLENKFADVVQTIEPGGYLWIGTLSGTPSEVPKLYARCNPGDRDSVDWKTQNPKKRQELWENDFRKPLDGIFDRIRNGIPADRSPIMAGIQQVKLSVFDKVQTSGDAVPKRLIVASDMIENTEDYSQYSSGVSVAAYKDSRASEKYWTNLDGVEVTVLYVNRPDKPFKGPEHGEFWFDWVSSNKGKWGGMERLEGL